VEAQLTTSPRSSSRQPHPERDDRRSEYGQGERSASPRPFVIELAGTPRAGKTTALHGLIPRFVEVGYGVEVVTERAGFSPVPSKRDLDFNRWTAHSTAAEIIRARHAGKEVVLVDRGLFDVLVWMDWFWRGEKLSTDSHRTIDAYYRGEMCQSGIDLVLVMTVDPDEALSREKMAGSPGAGPIMNPGTLSDINESIDIVMLRTGEDFPLVHVPTTGLTPSETLRRVSDVIAGRLHASVPPTNLEVGRLTEREMVYSA
jgi:hypothetical protein